MKLFRTFSLLLLCPLLACASPLDDATKDKKSGGGAHKDKNLRKEHGPGLLDKLWAKIVPAKKPAADSPLADAVEREIGGKKLMLSMTIEPNPLKLAETRQMKVTLHVANKGTKMMQLEFPTTQRIEVVIRNPVGKMVEQWSEDRSFAPEPGMVSINPGERLEYSATLSTRDMTAGETYTIEALFPNYEALRLQKQVKTEK